MPLVFSHNLHTEDCREWVISSVSSQISDMLPDLLQAYREKDATIAALNLMSYFF